MKMYSAYCLDFYQEQYIYDHGGGGFEDPPGGCSAEMITSYS